MRARRKHEVIQISSFAQSLLLVSFTDGFVRHLNGMDRTSIAFYHHFVDYDNVTGLPSRAACLKIENVKETSEIDVNDFILRRPFS